jgi:Flp pilus assembly protein protease CpaA
MPAQTLTLHEEPADQRPDGEPLQADGSAAESGADGRPVGVLWLPVVGLGAPSAKSGPIGPGLAWGLMLSGAAILSAALQVLSGQAQVGFLARSLALVVALACGWSDLATRRISNRLTYPAILLALSINVGAAPVIFEFGWQTAHVWLGSPGPASSLKAFGLCTLIGVFGFSMRGLGGGDVKAMIAVGTFVGFAGTVSMLFNTLLVAAVLGVLNLASNGRFFASLQPTAFGVHGRWIAGARERRVLSFRPNEGPFAFSMALGLLIAQFVSVHDLVFAG